MPELKARLQSDLNQAMKSRDQLRTATLRMTLAAITTEEVAGAQARELSDDEVADSFNSSTSPLGFHWSGCRCSRPRARTSSVPLLSAAFDTMARGG